MSSNCDFVIRQVISAYEKVTGIVSTKSSSAQDVNTNFSEGVTQDVVSLDQNDVNDECHICFEVLKSKSSR